MRSAVDFLPWLISALMNLVTSRSLYFGSGRTLRFGDSRLRIDYLAFFTPYLERPWLRLSLLVFDGPSAADASSVPRTMWYRTPGRSFTRPPRTSTTECSWRLWPSPPMYAVMSMPLVRRTRATFRSAEFGFFGVEV